MSTFVRLIPSSRYPHLVILLTSSSYIGGKQNDEIGIETYKSLIDGKLIEKDDDVVFVFMVPPSGYSTLRFAKKPTIKYDYICAEVMELIKESKNHLLHVYIHIMDKDNCMLFHEELPYDLSGMEEFFNEHLSSPGMKFFDAEGKEVSQVEIHTVECNTCKKKPPAKLSKCAKCQLIYYCSKECQTQDWKRHKLECGKSPLLYTTKVRVPESGTSVRHMRLKSKLIKKE